MCGGFCFVGGQGQTLLVRPTNPPRRSNTELWHWKCSGRYRTLAAQSPAVHLPTSTGCTSSKLQIWASMSKLFCP